MAKKITRTFSLDIETAIWLHEQEFNASAIVNQLFKDMMNEKQTEDKDILSVEYDIEELEKQRSETIRELAKKKSILSKLKEEKEKAHAEYVKEASAQADLLRRQLL